MQLVALYRDNLMQMSFHNIFASYWLQFSPDVRRYFSAQLLVVSYRSFEATLLVLGCLPGLLAITVSQYGA